MKEVKIITVLHIDFGVVFESFDANGNSVGTIFAKEETAIKWANENGYKVVKNFSSK